MTENKKQFQTYVHQNNCESSSIPNDQRAKLPTRFKIPKIANKQIPMHNPYVTFSTLPLRPETVTNHRIWNNLTLNVNKKKEQEDHHASMFSRPEHMLKQYLFRKEKRQDLPIFVNPEGEDDRNFKDQKYKTINDFRIKKPKKALSVNMNHFGRGQDTPPEASWHQQNTFMDLKRADQDFLKFNTSRNLYHMTFQQLQQSIHWKKQFLQVLNSKIRESKTSPNKKRFIR